MSVLKKHNPLTDQWEYVVVGKRGLKGDPGLDGRSAYELAVLNGFVGTEAEWLDQMTAAATAEAEASAAAALSSANAAGTSAQMASDEADAAQASAEAAAATLAGTIAKALVKAKGDLIVATASGEVVRLPVGTTDGHALQIKSSETTGLVWQAIPDAFTGYFANSATPETPTGGGTLFVQDGALKFIGSSGTMTTIASA